MLPALGRALARHALAVVLLWAVLAVVGYAAAVGGVLTGESLFSRLTSGEPTLPSESLEGRELLSDRAETGPGIQLLLETPDPADPAVAAALTAVREDLTGVPGVATVLEPTTAGPDLVAADGSSVLVSVALERGLTADEEDAAVETVVSRLGAVAASVPGSTGRVGGLPLLVEDITSQVEEDLRTGEGVALPLSLLVMVVIFGGLAAAGVPILGALASIAGGLASLLAFSYVIDLDASVVNVVTVLGLGLCIDYSLLMVSRFREEVRRAGVAQGLVPDAAAREAAAARTMATAGRTVVFSAITVAISVTALLFFDIDIIRAVGAAAVSVVVVALVVALTLVPALAVLTSRWLARPGVLARVPLIRGVVARLGDIPPDEGFFSRLADRVQRRPVLVVCATTALLLLVASPVLHLELRNSGAELLPPGAPQREVFLDVQERFPALAFPPVQVVADAPVEEVAAWSEQVTEVPGVTAVGPPRTVGDLVVLDVRTEGPAQGRVAQQVVEDLRADRPDFDTWVTGQAAGLVDFEDGIARTAPVALLWIVVATFVLLFLMTGSLLIPVKALVMNVLSLGATFGALVWVFQDGRFESVLDFSSAGGIESTIPILVFAFAFGLSMDYEVFLLARVKELRDGGLDNDAAVRAGLQKTGRIITSAALIICLVFAGFVLGDLLVIKETGVALALAVAIDATVVRILLVPATMTLLGEWNWWAPGPLRRLHDRIGLREGDAVPSGVGAAAGRHARR
ncbi:MAG TPA: MMPL family transporter [Jiangellales bacterium]|nr:MMPL family transporter [Jiangellales bacterium]